MGTRGGTTVWNGTAFDCIEKEISLLHVRFQKPNRDFGACNNGAIRGESIGVDGNNYTSQLNVTVTPNVAGKIISCAYDNTSSTVTQFSSVIPRIAGNYGDYSR